MSMDARSTEELLHEIEMLRKRVSELEILYPASATNITSSESLKHVRVLDRKPLFIEVPIKVVEDPNNIGVVSNMTVKGVGVRGIRCNAGDRLRLQICPPEILTLDSFSFDAICRWSHEEESDALPHSGFEITDISPEDMSHLSALLMTLGYEYLRDQFRRKIGEEALKFIEASSDLICRTTENGVISFVNDAFCKFTALSRSSLHGLDFQIFVPEETRGNFTKFISDHCRDDYHGQYECPLVDASGQPKFYYWTVDTRCDSDSGSVEFQLVGRDITEPKKKEKQLRDFHTELERKIEDRTSQLERVNLDLNEEIRRRRRIEEALDKKLWALTRPDLDVQDLALTDLTNIEALWKLQNSFSEIWDMSVHLIGLSGEIIAMSASPHDFYGSMYLTESGKKVIQEKNAKIMAMTNIEPLVVHENYFLGGDSIYLVPIKAQDRNIGAWMIWKGLDREPAMEEVESLASEVGLDASSLLYSITSAPRIENSKLLKACTFLSLISAQVSMLAVQNLFQARMIHELNMAQDEVRRSERKLRNLLESAPIGIFLTTHGVISFANRALSEMYGFCEPLKMQGSRLESLFKNGKVGQQILELGKSERLHQTEYSDLEAVRANGDVFAVSVYSRKLSPEPEETVIGFVVDKSQENALRDQLLHAQKMEALGTFAGGIAHDFNNILTIIMGFSEMALTDTGRDHCIAPLLNQIIEASKRARDLVNQILTFCRKAEHQKQPLNVAPIIKETLKFLAASFPATIKIQSCIRDKGKLIMGDPSQIHQILMNLCSNAGYAMRKQGGVLDVDLEVVDAKSIDALGTKFQNVSECLKLSIKDSGPGIDPEIRERIFEPYFTTKPAGEGSGLGLAVVHGIVTSHSGVIRLNESYIQGALFEVYLPVMEAAQTRDELEAQEDLHGDKRVIVVDDEEPVTKIARGILEDLGYKVYVFSNPIAALNIFRVGPYDFDILITDLTMSEMTGLVLAREVKKIRPDLPVMLMTGYDARQEASSSDFETIDETIQKPFTITTLGKAVKRALKNSKKTLDQSTLV